MRARVLLDCDGVLADFHTPCLEIINKLGGTNHAITDLMGVWDIFEALKVSSEVERLTYDLMNKPGWCLDIGVYPGAREGLDALRKVADVYIVTSPMRGPTWTSERNNWLWKNFQFPTKDVLHASAKHVCAGDMLVDDRKSNLERWKISNPNGAAVRWETYPPLDEFKLGPSTNRWEDLVKFAVEMTEVVKMAPTLRKWHHEPISP